MATPTETAPSHVKATRADWLATARDILVRDGVGEVKVLALSARLAVSRSSFYWYFKSRDALLSALLDDWEARNTQTIQSACAQPAGSITEALCNFFLCFLPPEPFDRGLDFAVREWARRDAGVRARIDAADTARLSAIATMFETQGYPPEDADTRARILYYMQLGYHALEVREGLETRLSRLEGYLRGFSGQEPDAALVRRFMAQVRDRQRHHSGSGAGPAAPNGSAQQKPPPQTGRTETRPRTLPHARGAAGRTGSLPD